MASGFGRSNWKGLKMQTHELKTLPVYWDAVKRGEKTFEVRRDDRGFQKGDMVELIRHDGRYVCPLGGINLDADVDQYDRATRIVRRIRWVLTGGQFGIEPGYVVLQLEEIP